MPALAALVGGLFSGIAAPLVKDVFIQRWNEKRSDKKLQEEIEHSYLAPLSASAEKVIYRTAEILLDQRSHFLMLKTRPKDYCEYKRVSTLYRIAALLGWIRAINLELSALPRGGFRSTSAVSKALVLVSSAMADGYGVEMGRIEGFCSAGNIDISSIPKDQRTALAAKFEVAMYALAGEELRKNHRLLVESSALHQEFICRGLVQFLAEKGLTHPPDEQAFQAAIPFMIASLGYREVLIYREWQDAIGDAVIVKDEQSKARSYRIIGFDEFQRLMDSGTFNWIEPLRAFIEDIDFEVVDPTDGRSKHLSDFATGVAEVLDRIDASSKGALVNPDALKLARRIIKLSA